MGSNQSVPNVASSELDDPLVSGRVHYWKHDRDQFALGHWKPAFALMTRPWSTFCVFKSAKRKDVVALFEVEHWRYCICDAPAHIDMAHSVSAADREATVLDPLFSSADGGTVLMFRGDDPVRTFFICLPSNNVVQWSTAFRNQSGWRVLPETGASSEPSWPMSSLTVQRDPAWAKDHFLDLCLTGSAAAVTDFYQQQFASDDVDPFWHQDGMGRTALHIAVERGRVAIVETILNLSRNVTINAELSPSMNTPLHIAALKDDFMLVKLLLSRRADASARNIEGMAPFQLASSDQVRRLLSHANRGYSSRASSASGLPPPPPLRPVASVIQQPRSTASTHHATRVPNVATHTSPSSSGVSSMILPGTPAPSADKETIDPSGPSGECCVCMTFGVNSALIPCGHSVMCMPCARKVTVCPVCRTTVSQLLRLYR